MRKYPIPLINLKEAIEKGRYESLYYKCKITKCRHLYFIKARSTITKRNEYWVYNSENGDYELEEVDYIGRRD